MRCFVCGLELPRGAALTHAWVVHTMPPSEWHAERDRVRSLRRFKRSQRRESKPWPSVEPASGEAPESADQP